MKTGKTRRPLRVRPGADRPAMEPGHEDREDADARRRVRRGAGPAMEPGHEDREDPPHRRRAYRPVPAMEPGHEDREDSSGILPLMTWTFTARREW